MSTLGQHAGIRSVRAEPVTVVGAGPAGLSCAIALARAGRRVVVREWHRDVAARFHGDFQGIENWSDERDVLEELRAAGIEPTFDHHPVTTGTVFDSRGGQYEVRSPQPLYYLVRRGAGAGSLDRGLLQQAVEAGVEIRFGDRVDEVEGEAVLATGPRLADIIAVGYVFDTSMPDGGWLVLDDRLAPRGYAYLLVQSGRGTVASCMFTGFKHQAEHVRRTLAFFSERAGLEMHNARPFGGLGSVRMSRTAMHRGHPVIGEQAGFQDALAGFGIRFAIRSGLIAARSIIEGSDYTRAWRRELLPLIGAGIVNRFIVNLVGNVGGSLALRRLSRGDARQSLRRLYQPSISSRLLLPIARLRRPGGKGR